VLVLAPAVRAALGSEVTFLAKAVERVEMAIHGQQDVAPLAAVASGWASKGNVFLTPKGDTSVTTIASLDVDLGLVVEHVEKKDTAKGGDVKKGTSLCIATSVHL
jgi:hypothetical protein